MSVKDTDARTNSKAPSPAIVLATLFAAVGLLYPFGLAVVQRLLLLTYHLDSAAAWQATSLVAKTVAVQWGVRILLAGNTLTIMLAFIVILLCHRFNKLVDRWLSRFQSDTAPIVLFLIKIKVRAEYIIKVANALKRFNASRWMKRVDWFVDILLYALLYGLVLLVLVTKSKPSGADVLGLVYVLAPALACAALFAVLQDTKNSQSSRLRLLVGLFGA